MPPPTNSIIATTKLQKYTSREWPKGWISSGGRRDRRSPTSISASLPVSTSEWMASLSIAALPVYSAAANLITAMPRLAAIATMTTLWESWLGMDVGLGEGVGIRLASPHQRRGPRAVTTDKVRAGPPAPRVRSRPAGPAAVAPRWDPARGRTGCAGSPEPA